MNLLFENWRRYLNEGKLGCIPIDEWSGPPSGIHIWSHSTGRVNPSNFNEVINTGFRVATSGMGSLSITFLEEGIPDVEGLKASLRKRVQGESYNLGNFVVLAGIDPRLEHGYGIDDDVLQQAKTHGPSPMGLSPLKNVDLFESFPENHMWSKNAKKLPGRFLLALYDGVNDTICLNPEFNGSEGTEEGRRLRRNWEEYQELEKTFVPPDSSQDSSPAVTIQPPGDSSDFDIF